MSKKSEIKKHKESFYLIISALLFGKISERSSRERIFTVLSFSFGNFFALIGIVFILHNEIFFGILLILAGVIGFSYLYYTSRFKNKPKPWLFLAFFLSIFTLIWGKAHGFYGDIHLLLIPGIISFASIFKPKHYFVISLIIGFYLLFLFGIENYYSQIFINEKIVIPEYQPIIIFAFTLLVSGWVVGSIIYNNSLKIKETDKQKEKIELLYKDMLSSVNYAYNIQNALLPSSETLNTLIPQNFILYKPRDIVSGDFYWVNKNQNKTFVVVADCTGHGVPGAFMSMLGISLLNEIILSSTLRS
ncbi:MAG: hypothetical protein JXL97_19110 [Bacteroidales bacterium]|nr:hypothetical protein [Bacteroidales bacterium]